MVKKNNTNEIKKSTTKKNIYIHKINNLQYFMNDN
jgi:hypothetical protein